MTVWMTLIVEEKSGNWSAWFKKTPESRSTGKTAQEAMSGLLFAIGADKFDANTLRIIEENTRNQHLEFTIRFTGCGYDPKPSKN